VAFSSRGRPNVTRLARRGKVDDLRAALRYGEDGAAPGSAAAVRVEAAEALAGFDGATVAGDLAEALRDPAPEVRLAAIGSLEAVGVQDAEQVDRLTDCVVARGERAPELAARALKLIVASVPEGGAELLADRLLEPSVPEPDEGHRASLDLLLTADSQADVARGAIVDALIWRLEHGADEVAERRAEVLLAWLGETARDRVLHALENGTVSPAVMRAAGRLGDARAIGPVIAGLGDSDSRMREAAAHAARALNHTRAVPALLTATQDDEQAVRDAASDALDRMGTAAVIAGLAAVVDAQGLLQGGGEDGPNGEQLGAHVAQALEEGLPADGEAVVVPEAQPDGSEAAAAPEAQPDGSEAAAAPGAQPDGVEAAAPAVPADPGSTREATAPAPAAPPAYPPRPRRGGLLDRLFGTRDY
jgi:HEAT repeat protein